MVIQMNFNRNYNYVANISLLKIGIIWRNGCSNEFLTEITTI